MPELEDGAPLDDDDSDDTPLDWLIGDMLLSLEYEDIGDDKLLCGQSGAVISCVASVPIPQPTR